MRTDELDFHLPEELIAQTPAEARAGSRLLRYRRRGREMEHLLFSDLPGILGRGDLLVFNDARVIPARFALRKKSGGRVDGLYLSVAGEGVWRVLLKGLGKAGAGVELEFEDAGGISASVIENLGEGEFLIRVAARGSTAPHPGPLPGNTGERGEALGILERVGRMPLPPYIRRGKARDPRDELDRERYQTVYAKNPGAVAAPTAGLHFSEALLGELDRIGVERVSVTLHVGMGTFKPVGSATLEGHAMHREEYEIDAGAAEALNRAKGEGRRIVAVGTTSARVLESQRGEGAFVARRDSTDLLIYPPYSWKHVGALVTNFHLPRSTLIALVAAMVGLDEQRRIYAEAIARKYRFFSYGDAMFIE